MDAINLPMYVAFVIINIAIIWVLIRKVLKDDDDSDGSNDGGMPIDENPDLDLPPGVTLPKDTEQPAL